MFHPGLSGQNRFEIDQEPLPIRIRTLVSFYPCPYMPQLKPAWVVLTTSKDPGHQTQPSTESISIATSEDQSFQHYSYNTSPLPSQIQSMIVIRHAQIRISMTLPPLCSEFRTYVWWHPVNWFGIIQHDRSVLLLSCALHPLLFSPID